MPPVSCLPGLSFPEPRNNVVSNASPPTISPSAGLFGFFANRRINTKVMFGFAAVLTLLAVLAVAMPL